LIFRLCEDDELGMLLLDDDEPDEPFAVFEAALGVVDRLFEFPFTKLPLFELFDECIFVIYLF
jgi:hypothetical protein